MVRSQVSKSLPKQRAGWAARRGHDRWEEGRSVPAPIFTYLPHIVISSFICITVVNPFGQADQPKIFVQEQGYVLSAYFVGYFITQVLGILFSTAH